MYYVYYVLSHYVAHLHHLVLVTSVKIMPATCSFYVHRSRGVGGHLQRRTAPCFYPSCMQDKPLERAKLHVAEHVETVAEYRD